MSSADLAVAGNAVSQSEGRIEDSTIGDWLSDALAAFDRLAEGPQILVGSSMGGWIALLVAVARPERIRALVGVAAAPDFTERLLRQGLSQGDRAILARDGVLYRPRNTARPPLHDRLAGGRPQAPAARRSIPLAIPVRLLHGQRDPDVPWQVSLTLAERLETQDVGVALVKDGDHRLSAPKTSDSSFGPSRSWRAERESRLEGAAAYRI